MNILDDIKFSLHKIKEKIISLDSSEKHLQYLEAYTDDPDLSTLLQMLRNMKYDDIKGNYA